MTWWPPPVPSTVPVVTSPARPNRLWRRRPSVPGAEDYAAKLVSFFTVATAVAYSGGADSALVLTAAVRALGPDRVLAVTALSESYPEGELAPGGLFAARLGVEHLRPDTHEIDVPGYRANGTDRCYFCKTEVLEVVGAVAAAHGVARVATGTNADDARDPFRPGIRAG